PRLESVEGVAEITVQGGQVLPGEADLTEVAAAEDNPPPDNPGEGGGVPIATPFWKLIGGQIGAALGGQAVEDYEDLTPELTNLVLALVDGLGVPLVTREGLLNELRVEAAVEALPADTLAWLPPDYATGMNETLKARADARIAAET